MTADRKFTDNHLRFILNDISKEELIEEIVVLNAYIDTKTTARLANPHSHNRYSTMSRVQLVIDNLVKARTDERNKVIGEIEEIVNEAKAKNMKEQYGLNAMVILAVIQAKLNSLKNP